MDSVPIVAITGQVFSTLMGTDAFQEADIVGITMPMTKHSILVKQRRGHPGCAGGRRSRSPRPAARAPCSSTSRRTPSRLTAPFVWPARSTTCPATVRSTKAHGKQIQAAADAARGGEEAGSVRRRRRDPRPCSRRAEDARRDDRSSRRHDAHGARARSPTRTSSTSACPACTAPFRPCSRCRRATSSSRSVRGSTTA